MHSTVKRCLAMAFIGTFPLVAGLSAQRVQAEPSIIPGVTVMTIVKWSGTDCVVVRTADGSRDLCDAQQQPPTEAIVEHGKAVGDLVGADPVMGRAAWIGCELFLNGRSTVSDVALAGDGSDVSCLTTLR